MALNRTVYLSQWAVSGGTTYDKGTGGTLNLEWDHSATPVKDRTGTDFYPTSTAVVDGDLTVTVTMRDVSVVGKLSLGGAAAVCTASLATPGSTTVAFTKLVLIGTRNMQRRGDFASGELIYALESSDGSTNPVS